jgi:hypothetical protein
MGKGMRLRSLSCWVCRKDGVYYLYQAYDDCSGTLLLNAA